MSPRHVEPLAEKHARDADKGAGLMVLFICLPFCVLAGLVVLVAG